jgi:methionine-rich copper-binding protein CopC
MTTRATRRWSLTVAVLGSLLLGTVMASIVLAGTAQAAPRVNLVSSTPAAESQIDHLPTEIELRFSEALTGTPQVSVLGPDGNAVPLGAVSVRGEVARIPVLAGPAGEYVVAYTATGSEGRPTPGSFRFTVTAGTAPTRPSRSASRGPSPAAAPVGVTSPDVASPQPIADSGTEAPGRTPLWWTLAGVALIAACALVVIIGFGRRAPGAAPFQAAPAGSRLGPPSSVGLTGQAHAAGGLNGSVVASSRDLD